MRRALLVAMVGVVLGALLLAGVGTMLAANSGARADAASELADDARRVATEAPRLLAVRDLALRRELIRVVRYTVKATFVVVAPASSPATGGTGASGAGGPTIVLNQPPKGVTADDLQLGQVLSGAVVSGTSGSVVYAAVALAGVSPSAVARLGTTAEPGVRALSSGSATAASTDTVVMVVTRPFAGAGLGGGYLLLVSGLALVVAAGVAVLLSRRITRPLVEAVGATERMAAGDLSVRLPEDGRQYRELDSLTRSINVMAAALARAKGQERQFLLSVSHDLRTPLTSILGYAEAIGDGATDNPGAAAAVIATEARRLGRLVQDLLDLARLDARQFSLQVRPTPLAPLLAATADGLRPLMDGAGLRLEVWLPPGDPLMAMVDPDRTAQVVANLLENAYKFAGTTVALSATAGPGGVVVAVTDDGPGIAPEETGRIFERLYQSHRAPTRQAGTGLGLAIVAELVAAMGGALRVVSPVGPPGAPGGSRFEVGLPAAQPYGGETTAARGTTGRLSPPSVA